MDEFNNQPDFGEQNVNSGQRIDSGQQVDLGQDLSGGSVSPQTQEAPYAPHGSAPAKHSHGGIKAGLIGLAGGVVGAGAVMAVLLGTGLIGPAVVQNASGPSKNITISASHEDTSIAEAVATKCLPSVVSISVSTPEGEALGSGVVFDKEGNIITNYHVVEGAMAVTVTIEGKTYKADIVGSDSSSDIAVIKADLKGAQVTPIEVADSDKLVVGDWVMTLGSPFGLDQSVSAGIVSALYRSTLMASKSGTTVYANLIQIDAAVNQGNSGGALVNDEGKLVGINTLVESTSGDFSGIGFSIPGNYAVNLAKKIIAGEKITHAYIGISMLTINAQNAGSLEVNEGAYVAEVDADGPAAAAGIKKGDVITAIDNKKISSADAVILSIRSHAEGDEVTVTVNRQGKETSMKVTLGNDEELQLLQQKRNREQRENNSQGFNPFEGFGE